MSNDKYKIRCYSIFVNVPLHLLFFPFKNVNIIAFIKIKVSWYVNLKSEIERKGILLSYFIKNNFMSEELLLMI